MKRRLFFFLTVFYITAAVLSAQSNDIIDSVLGQEKLTCGNGAYLALTAAGLIEDDASVDDALMVLKKNNWIGESRSASDEMSLGEYSFALMQGFDIPGGLMYSLFPSARYASRELGYLGYISRDAGAYRSLKGSEAVSILGQILRKRNG